MKSRLTAMLLSLMLMLAMVVPAYAQATVNEYSFPVGFAVGSIDPCSGHPVTLNIAGEAHLQEVTDGSGGFHSNFQLRGVITVTDDVTGAVRQGPINWIENFSSRQGNYTFVYAGHVVEPGSANDVIVHLVIHASPNGVSFVADAPLDECH
jgi:hypothetical protein